MSEREAFDRILASLHEAALDDAHWSTASGLIDEALRAHGSSMVFGDGDSEEDIRIYFLWQFFRQALAGAGALGASLTTLLDTAGLGIVQLDGRGRIVAANDRARDLLRSGDGLFDEDGFLCARRPEENTDLQGLLTRALPQFGGQGAGGSTMVRRSSALPPLVLHVNPVGRQETDLRVWPVAAFVLVVDPASHTRIDPGVAAATLGFTGMESRVGGAVGRGHERPRGRCGDRPQGKHDPLACEAHVRQARPVAASGAGTACAVVGWRSGVPALTSSG